MVVIGRFDRHTKHWIAHLLVLVVAIVVTVGGGCGGGTCWMYARATRTSADQLNRRTRTMNPMTEGRQWSRMQGNGTKRTSTGVLGCLRRNGLYMGGIWGVGNGFVCQDGTCFIVIRWSYG